ncbi:MAG: dehydrogenase [Bacteroidetes bacterium GWF2_42_66]|nr:MAG: dehydrogenase [Bacteroidetes bacterium GWA2_42_15]OFX96357.1 MAG: dehydrogenase [Bacteroidetes bacterium GWE2_42_39]OFY46396.1 MAG: dehydrogenase [Bacteroidetes bacterium GWF2_42_66]HAZ03740.1 dehydrogenase [Marinilabiliales bacterium]HBL78218.1 dehydrogenase [Prolixibacteraceae bacterium]
MKNNRRDFIKKSAAGVTALYAGGILSGFSARSYKRISGASERINLSFMGVNSRGNALAKNFAGQDACEVVHVCDVDSRAIDKCCMNVEKITGKRPAGFGDFRKSLESKDVDALVIAAPDHWHAPASLLAMQAGKHVYVEKPCSHNPWEGEMLVEAVAKYGKVLQMGNQRRSYPNVIKAMTELKSGIIGRVYFGRSWYTNNRLSIGTGKEVAVPDWLDWNLWQGPAPRKAFKDNLVHYNWHWRWHWGTGEALNNGTHMVDLLRWGLGVDFPIRVSSNGGRYHFKDDWETPDTQVINMDFPGGVSMTWEGRSCNGRYEEGLADGAIFYGEKGSLTLCENSYTVYNLNNEVTREIKDDYKYDNRDRVNPTAALDVLHFRNFFDGIKNGAKTNSDIDSAHKSVLLMQLGNIAQRVGHSLDINPENGHILHDKEAMKYWSRTYEKGWEMKL